MPKAHNKKVSSERCTFTFSRTSSNNLVYYGGYKIQHHPHGLSKGSDAPNPPDGLAVAGVAADVHPPKSSSAVTVGCWLGLFADDMGAPQPPEMSFGVIREGTLPSSTFGGAGLAGSGAPHAFVSAPPHGSNILEFDGEATAGFDICEEGAVGFGAVIVGEDKLKGDAKADGLCMGGEGILGAGAAGVLVGAEEKLLNPSSPNKSAGIAVEAGFGAGGEVGACVKEKFRAFEGRAAGAGFGAGGLVAVAEKKSPPLRGGGEVICAAAGGALAGRVFAKFKPLNADDDDDGCGGDVVLAKPKAEPDDCVGGGGDLVVAVGLEKLMPPNASASPPNASVLGGDVYAIPPNDG